MEPGGSCIRPHRRRGDPKEECIIGIRGRVALIISDDALDITSTIPLGPAEDAVCVDVPIGCDTRPWPGSRGQFFSRPIGAQEKHSGIALVPWAELGF
jgi:hypothetical protein